MNLSTRKLLTILLVVLLVATLSLTLFACNTEEPTPSTEPVVETPVAETLVIPNGDFKTTTGTTYPKVPTSWTGAPGSTSGSTATLTGTDNLIAGVISVDESVYNQNKATWGSSDNPGKQGEDDNVLMIYNKVSTAYKYTNSFSPAVGKYYKISIPVRTNLSEGKGAYIYITGGAYAKFEAIDTMNTWRIYDVYVEASLISSESITITVALGYGATDSGNMTKGYAFFDKIMADEITANDYTASVLGSTTAKYSMRVPDSHMEYYTGTALPYGTYGYSSKTGTGAGGSAPSYSTDVTKGILDTTTAAWLDTYGTNPENAVDGFGNKILMIYNKNATASGYAGKRNVRFGIGGYYELSVDVNVTLEPGQTLTDYKGVTLALTGADSFKIQYIDTNSAWVRYSFFIKANQVRDKDFTLEMWLGQGGKEDTDTLTEGIAYFDNVTLTSITEETYQAQLDAKTLDPDNYPNYVASLISPNSNLIDNYNLEEIDDVTKLPTGWVAETTSTDVIVNTGDVKYISISDADLKEAEWTTELQTRYFGLSENPLAPYPTMSPVFMIDNSIPTVSGMGMIDMLDINPNLHYRLAIWLKTVDIAEGKGVNINLVSGTGDDQTTVSSFTTINTLEYENTYTNDYLEIVFLIQGNELLAKDARVVVEIGSGTAFTPANYIEGYSLFANVNMEQITYTEYNSTSTTSYIKKYSFQDSKSTVSNGSFNKLNLQDTVVNASGELTDKPGVPASWTASSSTEDNIISGIININNAALMTALGLSNIYNNDGWTVPPYPDQGAPNLIMIKTLPAVGEYDGTITPYGYSSTSFTLSANSYYIIKAFVKTVVDPITGDSTASIFLSPTTNTNPDNFLNIKTEGKWEEFTFAVATGRDSVTTKVDLYLGNKASSTKVSGTVFFDSVSYATITEDQYDALTPSSNVKSISYEIETFDNVNTSTSPTLPTPKNWTGALGNSAVPSGTTNILYGVVSGLSSDVSALGVKDGDGNIIEASKIDNETMTDIIFNDAIVPPIGDNVLMMNNLVPSAYSYKTSSSETLTKASYYEISIWAFTYYISEGKSARIMLSIGEDTFTFKNVNTTTFVDGVATTGTWTKYTYYVKTAVAENTTSAYLTLGLGKYLASDTTNAGLVSGYAFYDNLSINLIDEATFTANKASFDAANATDATADQKKYLNTNSIIIVNEPESSTPSDPTEETPEEPTEPESNFPWLLMSSVLIGSATVIALIILMLKKLYPKIAARRKLKFKKSTYDRSTSKDKTTTKSNRYDKYKD